MEREKYRFKKKIENALRSLDQLPLLPAFFFNWNEFNEKFSQQLFHKNFQVSAKDAIWRKTEKIHEGFSDDLLVQACILTPLEGKIFLLIDRKEMKRLISHMLMEPPIVDLSSEPLQEGYYRYLCLLTLDFIQAMPDMSSFSFKLLDDAAFEEEGYLCRDLQINLSQGTSYARLAISPTFRQNFMQHYQARPSLYEKDWGAILDLPLRLEGGKTYLSYEEIQELKIGDFFLFDKTSYDPKTQKGLVTLVLGESPLFHAKIKTEKIKIVDYAFYYEDKTMDPEEDKIFEEPEDEQEVVVPQEADLTREKALAIKDTPICLTAEIGRFSMSLENLLKLQPGNYLELAIFPQDTVHLTVNGKIVGKGEIVHLGEAIGVRVIEIHK